MRSNVTLNQRKSTSPHSTDRIFEGSRCSPQGQQYRRIEDPNLLCPELRGPDSESSRTYQGARRSGTKTPAPGNCMATHICKVKVEMSKTIFVTLHLGLPPSSVRHVSMVTCAHHFLFLFEKKGRFYQIITKALAVNLKLPL